MRLPSKNDALTEKIASLRRKPFAELEQLPDYQEQEITCDDGKLKIAIWKEKITPSELRIIVQSYRDWLFGLATTSQIGGFRANLTETYDLKPADFEGY